MQSCYEELVAVDVHATDYIDAIQQAGEMLFFEGFVKDTYTDAVISRESIYPTGLKLKDLEIAMPHTAGIHVNKPAVCVIKLAEPVTFAHMGDPDTKVHATMLFMMAIKNADEQIETLQNVMNVFHNEEAIAAFKAASTKEELFEAAYKYIG